MNVYTIISTRRRKEQSNGSKFIYCWKFICVVILICGEIFQLTLPSMESILCVHAVCLAVKTSVVGDVCIICVLFQSTSCCLVDAILFSLAVLTLSIQGERLNGRTDLIHKIVQFWFVNLQMYSSRLSFICCPVRITCRNCNVEYYYGIFLFSSELWDRQNSIAKTHHKCKLCTVCRCLVRW